jgi:hypothetical protein
VDEVAKNAADIAKALTGFASMGYGGWIAAGVFSVVVAGAAWYVSKVAADAKKKEANDKTDQGRVDAGGKVPQEGREAEKDGQSAADEVKRAARAGRPDGT